MEILETKERGKTYRRIIFAGECYGKYEVVRGGFRPHGRKKIEMLERACVLIVLADQIRKTARRLEWLGEVSGRSATEPLKVWGPPRPYVEVAKRRVNDDEYDAYLALVTKK